VPLVDWGVRFDAVPLPVRLDLDVRSIDRDQATRVATSSPEVGAAEIRRQATDAITAWLTWMTAIVAAGALALGALAALALRSRHGPRLRWLLATAAGTAVACGAAVPLGLAPRGAFDAPTYFAHGPDIPRALRALETASRSSDTLGQELDAQLVGLAGLVATPAGRQEIGPSLPRAVIASDLHNNLLALPALRRAAGTSPVLFAGDLTDSGTPIETELVRSIVGIGHPFVFVPGNHDSDVLRTRLADAGAIVLGTRGRLLPGGRHGPPIVVVAGMRIAGYDDPNLRRGEDGYADRGATTTVAEQTAFADWLRPLVGRIDVVMLHEPQLATIALEELRRRAAGSDPAPVFVVGHTHRQSLDVADGVDVINGGTLGAGGTGNLGEDADLGLAVLTYARAPRFAPLAADLVRVDPRTGSAHAERRRLDEG